ncbi:MAG: PKD domain-containing protein [Bacteroidota bacterium]
MTSYIQKALQRFLALTLLVAAYQPAVGQVFWSESFGVSSGTCDQGTTAALFASSNGIWNVTSNGTQAPYANNWYISSTECGQPNGICSNPNGGCIIDPLNNTNRTLHVGSVAGSPNPSLCASGDCGAIYDPGGFQNPSVATDRRAESPIINCTGKTNVQLSFLYILGGIANDDYGTVDYFDGTSWQTIDVPVVTFACSTGATVWTQKILSLPASASNNPNVRIGFSWKNGEGGAGLQPSFAVDEIQLINIPPPTNSDFVCSDTDFVICAGNTVDFLAVTTGVSAWSWIFTGAVPGNATGQNPTGITFPSPGTFDVYMISYNTSGSDTVIKQMTVNACVPPVASFAASDTVFCERGCIDFIDLSLNDPNRWTWQFPGASPVTASNLQSPTNICYPTPGFYDVILTVQNDFGVDSLRKSLYIQVESCPLPIASFTASSTIACNNQCINFNNTSQYVDATTTYEWYFPGAANPTSTDQSPQCVVYPQDGLYDVQLIVTNQYGSDTSVIYSYIRIESVPSAYAGPDTAMAFGSSYQLSAGGGATYNWSPAAGLTATDIPNPVATPTVTTTYTCSISDGSGCTTTRQVTVTLIFDNNLYVPNCFSPNGDGSNDYLFVRGNNFRRIRFSVFDRWGELIFETEDPLIGWDGKYNGKELNPGVFTWVASLTYDNQTPLTTSGTVTLLR